MKSKIKLSVLSLFFASTILASSLDQGAYNVSVAAKSLIAAYEENEVRADSLYAGKFISVGGKAGKVRKESDGDPYLELFASDSDSEYGPNLHCRFSESYAGRLSSIRPGTLIGVKGLVVGRRDGVIILKNCSL